MNVKHFLRPNGRSVGVYYTVVPSYNAPVISRIGYNAVGRTSRFWYRIIIIQSCLVIMRPLYRESVITRSVEPPDFGIV